MYRKFTDAQWAELFQQCKSSGLSDYEWCRQNHIPSSTFYKHLKIIREQACNPLTESKVNLPEYHEVIPLVVCDKDTNQKQPVAEAVPAISISIHDMKLDIYSFADRTIIAETLMAVKSIC